MLYRWSAQQRLSDILAEFEIEQKSERSSHVMFALVGQESTPEDLRWVFLIRMRPFN